MSKHQVILACQKLLADWIVPDSGISDHDVLNSLLGILDGPQSRESLAEPVPAVVAEGLVERLREEAEFHCVGTHQGFSETAVADERALMALLNEAAAALERPAGEVRAWVLLDQHLRAPDDGEDFERVELAKDISAKELKRFRDAGRAEPLYAHPSPERAGGVE